MTKGKTTLASIALSLLIGSVASAALKPLPRIAPKSAKPVAQFVDESGKTFAPFGVNYVRLDWIDEVAYHTTMNATLYNPARTDREFKAIAENGYNLIRVFVDQGDAAHQSRRQYGMAGPADHNTAELHQPAVDAFVDLLRLANKHGLYVIVDAEYGPANQWYINASIDSSDETVGNYNWMYLRERYIQAKALYLQKLVEAVKQAEPNGALLSTVFAWELQNEIAAHADYAPFSKHSGTTTTPDGGTYDMASTEDRQLCWDSNVVNWADTLCDAIRAVDPDAMVSASVFCYQLVGKEGANGLIGHTAEHRYPASLKPIVVSKLSFVDIHTYDTTMQPSYDLESSLNTSGFAELDKTKKPFLMGEYGTFKDKYEKVEDAKVAMLKHQKEMRRLGFAGNLFWTWDTYSQKRIWNLTEEDDVLLNAMKPETK
ncbi:MAG: hypothetical protein DRP64_00185 [Verrucomicrobia bacterium]|nr:MAG: hypothetical protein DRP64_00185 [Verrucomicrobiota bacterium]